MKTYTITVELEEHKSSGGFIDSLLSEISEESRQSAITHKINEATSKIHRKVLQDLVKELNEELGKVGLGFQNVEASTERFSNKYIGSRSTIRFTADYSRELSIGAVYDNSFKESKYTTYTGKYKLKFGDSTVKSVEDILSMMRGSVKEHIKRQQP